jgi:tetratricopeptide (TPR) repeat protein
MFPTHPARFGNVAPKARVFAVVSLVAAVATAAVVGYAARSGGEPPSLASALEPRAGAPPLALDLGVRVDADAVDLRRALSLYDHGHRKQAGAVFAVYHSLEAQVGGAIAAWPIGSLARLTALAAAHPRSGVVQVNLGLALFWAGRPGSIEAWRRAAAVAPNSSYAITADNLLYPRFNRNLPSFVPAEAVPAELDGKSPPEQLAVLRRNAATGSAKAKLLFGVALQTLFRPIWARREFDAAVRQAPDDPETLTAAAVARFDKANLAASFSRLGPLTRRFPHAATVRFHLGLLLLWTGSFATAEKQLRLATTVEPGSPLAREATRFLATLKKVRKK